MSTDLPCIVFQRVVNTRISCGSKNYKTAQYMNTGIFVTLTPHDIAYSDPTACDAIVTSSATAQGSAVDEKHGQPRAQPL